MNIVLWVVQVLLAIAFLGVGFMKVSQPIDKLKTNMGWVTHTTPPIVRLVGALEILGGLGLLLPGLTHILPILTAIAALGLVLTMIGAAIVHIRLKETAALAAPIILLLLSLFIVIGRFAIVPLS
ncbi:MAG TPA: DoxX family protein [Ktedonobacteraceae bacterium]